MVELHLRESKGLGKGGWVHFATIIKPLEFSEIVGRPDEIGGVTKDLVRAISAIFEVPVRMVWDGIDVVIDEISA